MWIKSIILENFKNIKTGLKANRLEIDFSKRENVICLITGPNGMGKTSLLSCLTPFATLGNLDIRENNQLILDRMPGYKQIVIMNGNDEIDIEHFYSVNKDSHSVKSYFKLNGAELNPNGNVTSFKSIVNEVLHIDMDYLKLIRLGDNVTNLIKLKGTERKNFMSKMLPSVDNYLKYYKKISGDVRDLNVLMSHLIDKINKLNIENDDKYSIRVSEVKKTVSLYEEEIEKLSKEIYEIQFKIDGLGITGTSKEDLRNLKKKESKYRIALEKNSSVSVTDIETFQQTLESDKADLIKLGTDVDYSVKENERLLNEIDEVRSEIKNIERELENIANNSDLISLQNYLKQLLEQDKKGYEGLPFKATFTKEELDEFVVTLKNIQRELNITYEFGDGPIKEVLDMIDDNVNVVEFVTANILAYENEKNRSQKTYLDTLIDRYEKMKPVECDKDCVYKKLWADVMSVKEVKSVKKTTKSPEYYQIVKIVHENISTILEQLKECSDFIKKLPAEYQSMFIKKKVFGHMKKCELIYDEKRINELMSIMTEYDNWCKLQKDIEETKKKIKEETEKSNISFYEDQLEKQKAKYAKLTESFDENKEKLLSSKDEFSKLTSKIEDTKDIIGALTSYNEVRDEMVTLEEKLRQYESLLLNKQEKEKDKMKNEKNLNFVSGELANMELNYREYKKLNKELDKCKEMYDDYVLLRSALSTKEGIPLLHIQMYLKDTKELANDLLDIVYGGDIVIDDFLISGDEFKIPYIKNGNHIPDISYASQGEQSFLNMAISFALSIQNLTEYNIPLLDEVDATFDQEKREKAIAVIEKQNEIIQSEQTFIISHNSMYDQYPVDVLDFAHFEDSIFDIKLG